MKQRLLFLIALFVAPAAWAQEAPPVYQTPSQSQSNNNVRFRLDAILRQEWTKDIFLDPGEIGSTSDHRERIQVRPRVELGGQTLTVGVGGEVNYSSDKNTDPKPDVLQDNYKSRDVRLDLAFARVEPLHWLRIDGGRFVMPVGLTEMIWDKDIRPQGGALTLQAKDSSGLPRFSVTALGARGSSAFDDNKVDMLLLSGQGTFGGVDSNLQIVGSYVDWKNAQTMEPMIRRQNTKVNGELVDRYHVLDFVVRLRQAGNMPLQLVADMSWNTAVSTNRSGLWLAASLGGLKTSLLRGEYTFAKVDKDATLGAYAADDFLWTTGWKAHRLDLGTRAGEKTSFHAVGEVVQFKDSPELAERTHWTKRLRLEMRVHY